MQDNTDIASLTREELELEYTRTAWILVWALHKMGGSMTIRRDELEEGPGLVRVWYSYDDASRDWTIFLKEHE